MKHLLLVAALLAPACHRLPILVPDTGDTTDTGSPEEPDLSDHVYDIDHLLRVEIEIEREDWDALRVETRDVWSMMAGEDCQTEPWGSPFAWYPADVTLDGERFPHVAVRKKGFLGSLSETKPALKLDLSEYGEEATFWGVDHITLNNAVQDPAYLRQCLGYGFFRDAGMPASRCSYATVAVNGQELGVFVNVEPIKEPFLRRNFGSDSGGLLEGTLSDFREGWTGTFEAKNDAADPAVAEVITAALARGDGEVLAALDGLVDLDAFYTHWAAEVLSVHIDGYAWNTNNYYLYADPADGGRLRFIPWGIDGLLYGESDEGLPSSVYAYGALANRLFGLEDARAAYRDRLRELLDGPWDEDVLNARIDRDRALVLDAMTEEEAGPAAEAIEGLRARMNGRRDEVNAGLEREEGWDYGLHGSFCFEDMGDLSATFATTWGSIHQDAFTYGDADLTFVLGEETYQPTSLGVISGDPHDTPVIYVAAWLNRTEAVLVYMTLPQADIAPGEVELGLGDAVGALYYIDTTTMEDFAFVSYLFGTLHLSEGGTEQDAPIVGWVDGDLMSWG